MHNKHISTCLGTVILVVIAITVGVFVWVYEKNITETPQITTNPQNDLQSNTPTTSLLPSIVPIIPSIEKAISSDVSTWKEYKNNQLGFSIAYPEELKLSVMGSEGQTFGKLIYTENSTGHTEALVYIYEPSSKDISNKPLAKTLNDYKKSYFVAAQRKIVIIKQEEKDINGMKMLKQVYSAGNDKEKLESLRGKLEPSDFDENNLEKMSYAYEQNAIRYIIPNKDGGFITIKTWKSDSNYEKLLDKIVSTFHLAPPIK